METAMFEQASRARIRFDTPQGQLTVEDLWSLPLSSANSNRANLDAIAIALHHKVRDAADTVSFVTPAADTGAALLQLKFDLVKHIISVRVAERDEQQALADRREKKQRILELIAQKQDAEMAEKSVDELRALAESL